MSDGSLKQGLAVILAADAVGYSRLMALDDRATVAVFETAAGAMSAALTVQAELAAQLADVSEDRKMRFRIGVDMGDVIAK